MGHDTSAHRFPTRQMAKLFALCALGVILYSFLKSSSEGQSEAQTAIQAATPPDGPLIACKALNVGDVWESNKYLFDLPIRNTTAHELTVSGFETSCSCISVVPQSLKVLSGETASITLTLDLCSLLHDEPNVIYRDFALQIRPIIDGPAKGQESWPIHGRVRRFFEFVPNAVSFGEFFPRKAEVRCRRFEVRCVEPVQDLKVVPGHRDASARVQAVPHAAGRFCVEVELGPGFPSGQFEFGIDLETSTATGHVVTGVIPVTGRLLDAVTLEPQIVVLGTRSVGDEVEQIVVARSRLNRALEFERVETSESDLEIRSDSSVKNTELVIRVRQRIAATGNHKSSARLFVRERGSGPLQAITLDVYYYGAKRPGQP
jgi:hypothetical protein